MIRTGAVSVAAPVLPASHPADCKGRNVALFNPTGKAFEVSIAPRDLWARRPLRGESGRFTLQLPHGAGRYRLA
jgi:hypothetical protein